MKKVIVTIDLSNITTEAEYKTAIQNTVEEFSALGDLYFKTQVINGLKEMNAGNKGRISVPDFMKKEKPVSTGTGQRGRKADSPEVKLAKIRAKALELEQQLLSSTKSENEISA